MSNVITDNELKKYTGNIFTATNVLQRNKSYSLDEIVNKGQVVLKCTLAGITKSSAVNLGGVDIDDNITDGSVKWKVISTTGYSGSGSGASISNWAANKEYIVGDFVIYDNFLYKCNTANNDSTFDNDKWTPISKDSITDWEDDTDYNPYDIIIKDNELYVCITSHTSSSDFTDDENNWLKIGSGSLNQVTKLNVTAPLGIDIQVPKSVSQLRTPVEVLKQGTSQVNVSINAYTFNTEDKEKFVDNNLVVFDNGAVKPSHHIDYLFSDPSALSTKYLSESDTIDLSNFSSVSSVTIVGGGS